MKFQIIKLAYDVIPATIIKTKQDLGLSERSTSIRECEYFRSKIDMVFGEFNVSAIYSSLNVDLDYFDILDDGNITLKNGSYEQILGWVGVQSVKALMTLLNSDLMGEILVNYNQELLYEQQEKVKYLQQRIKK